MSTKCIADFLRCGHDPSMLCLQTMGEAWSLRDELQAAGYDLAAHRLDGWLVIRAVARHGVQHIAHPDLVIGDPPHYLHAAEMVGLKG